MNVMRFSLFACIIANTAVSFSMAQDQIAVATPVTEATPASPTEQTLLDIATDRTAENDAKVDKPSDVKPSNLRPRTVAADLLSDTKITGTLVDATALQIKTAFGEAQIPLTEIAGVRFAVGQDNSTTVVMLNGDSISGATDLKSLVVETEWGTAKINGQSLVSLLFVPGLQWESTTGLNGKRWGLTEAKPKPGTNLGIPSGSLPSGNSINGVIIQGSTSQPANRLLPPPVGTPLNVSPR